MNLSGLDTMQTWIDNLRSINGLVEAAAEELAPVVKQQLVDCYSKGQSPYGDAWPLTKDGHQPLKNAAENVRVSAIGNTIVVSISDQYVFHNYGAGSPKRTLLPEGGLPPRMGDAIRLGLVSMGEEWLTRPGPHGRKK